MQSSVKNYLLPPALCPDFDFLSDDFICFCFVLFFSERILTTVTYAFNFNTLPSLPGGKPATE